MLGVPVVGTIARKKSTLTNLLKTIYLVCNGKIICNPDKIEFTGNSEEDTKLIFEKANEVAKSVCSFSNINYNHHYIPIIHLFSF